MYSLADIQETITNHYVIAILSSLCLYTIVTIIRSIFFHPLSSYPGPLLAKFSSYYTYAGVARRKRTLEQFELLKQYGSPCRIGPNELAFSDPQSINEIYGQSSKPCLKNPALYEPFTVTGARNVFNVVDRNQHSRLRRLLANGFAVKTLSEQEHLFMAKIDEYIEVNFGRKEGEMIDIYHTTHQLFLDIISFLGFGRSLDTLSGNSLDVGPDLESFGAVVPALSFAPGLRYLPIHWIQAGLEGVRRLDRLSRSMIKQYLERVAVAQTAKDEEILRSSLLHRLVTSKDLETGTPLTEEELAEHAILFLSAGSGTTAHALMWLLWQVARIPNVYNRLVKEIRDAFPNADLAPTYAEVAKLQYLQNVIDESLRLWGPLSTGAPRISPGKVIGGKFVPAGTVVGNNPYATARDPDTFPNPGEFNPTRWENATSQMRLMSRPFSSGPRNCIGRHLAEMTLMLTVVRLYQKYDIMPDASMTDEVMQIADMGPFKLWEERLLVRATPVTS